MSEEWEAIARQGLEAIQAAPDAKLLEEIRVRFLGRKGRITLLLHGLKDMPADERPRAGQAANRLKQQLEEALEARLEEFKSAAWAGDRRTPLDFTLPGRPWPRGHWHVITQTIDAIEDIFASMGFEVAEGPEVETDYYNFEAMNFPKDHPSRDMHDTFFISSQILLRTHTSPVQVRLMERKSPPLRAIMVGKTYRRDSDATHSPMFHQVEGLMIDRGLSFADLKGILFLFIQRLFGKEARLRFRPSYFPFTEPSAEVDMSCVKCQGKGCSLCKGTGWMEILGSGMVHPNVLRSGRVDPQQFTGLAFGMGVERIAMLLHGIDNMRYFYENDQRFLDQF